MSSAAKGRKNGSILDFFSKSAKKPSVAKKKKVIRLVSSPSTVATDEEEPSVSVKSSTPMKPQTKKPEPNYTIGTQVEKLFPGHGTFRGRVTKIRYDQGHIYGVTYEDGDEEENSETELKAILRSKKNTPTERTSPQRSPRRIATNDPNYSLLDKTKKPSAEAAAKWSSPRRSNKRRISYNEDDPEDDSEEEIVSSRRKTARSKAVLESSDGEEFDEEEFDEESDEEEDEESAASQESEQLQKRPAKKSKTSNVAKVSDVEMDDDADTVVASDDESEQEVKKPAAKKKKTSNGWGSLVAFKGPVKPKKKPAANKSTNVSGDEKKAVKVVKAAYTLGDNLPIISHPQGMFDDMISVQLTENGSNVDILIPVLQKLRNRPLRMATMCSGTESPVLAIDMLSKAIDDFYHAHKDRFDGILTIEKNESLLQIEHVFSCEIEPFKQAYIERNFQPPLLFRDIRELGNDQAFTAYGSLADVPCKPGDVDLLVAGTSCVDYSNLNSEKKTMEESGESGQTWRGMINWIRKAEPPIVIIENVKGAPWDKKIKIFEGLGYHAIWCAVDTKQYYIPHTRQRGYLFAIKKKVENQSAVAKIDQTIPIKWKQMLEKIRRPASAALDAFMLPNDDPRVLRGRARLTSSSRPDSSDRNNRVDWTKCEARHQFARANEELGEKRPLTGWSDSGNTTMPAFAWNEWVNGQVHRIHDLLDISSLRCAQEGIDCTYKTMVWNISQNVDRDTMGKLGLCQCLTPTGVPYVSNRGGPLVGEELLLLQGIPADDLLLTKESEDNLKDLAGNAMSTTVVGACMLSALVLGHEAIGPGNAGKSTDKKTVVPTLVPRPLALASSGVSITRDMAKYSSSSLTLGPLTVTQDGKNYYSHLLKEAASSARMCVSEGLDLALPVSSILQCKLCSITTNREFATPPRKFEEHDFVPMQDIGTARIDPSTFRNKLLAVLPMRVELSSFGIEAMEQPSAIDDELWSGWRKAAVAATASSEGSKYSEEYRFTRLTRSHVWTAVYSASGDSRLEFQLSKTGAVWLLFAKSTPEKGPLQESLIRPIARMHVTPINSCLVTSGQWEVCLPKTSSIDLVIEGIGSTVGSWRSKLGLKGGYESEVRYEKLKVSIQADGYDTLKSKIDGEYTLLPKCGGACGSLHVRQQDNTASPNVFFFLESGRRTVGDGDTFVFSHDKHRTAYGEYRDTVLQIDPAVNYRTDFYLCEEGSDQHARSRKVRAVLPGDWTRINDASLRIVSDKAKDAETTLTVPVDGMSVSLTPTGWETCPEILSCKLPIAFSDKLFMECERVFSRAGKNSVIEMNLQKSAKIFDNLAFVVSRLSTPNAVAQWLSLDCSGIERVDGEEAACSTCAPARPEVQWTVVTKSKKTQVIPAENGREAALYEQLMKHRPNPFLVTLRRAEQQETQASEKANMQLQIGCNAVSLVYRALGLFPLKTLARRAMVHHVNSIQGDVSSGDSLFEWRVVPHVEKSTESGDFPKLCLTSNKKDKPASQPPEFRSRYPLRPEQLRSLAWMLSREASSTPFYEVEVAEAVLPGLNWRAEGRARRPVLVRGGIVADEVGYGKTAITLGLIDAAPHANGSPPTLPKEFAQSFFHTKATLVIVPSHLMGQWPSEIKKFLGSTKTVLRINDMSSFNKLTVEDIQNADIILVNFTVLSGEKYFDRLARFAGVDTTSLRKGKTGGKHFDSVYKACLSGVAKRVLQLREDSSTAFDEIEKDADRNRDLASNDEQVRLDGKKSVYKTVSEEQVKAAGPASAKAKSSIKKVQTTKAPTTDIDPWNLRTSKVKNDLKKMACPPLEMFFWNRCVLDEFSYCCQKEDRSRVLALVLGLKSTFFWGLSGTPPHANFKDVQSLAGLLGIHLGIDDILPNESLKVKKGTNEEKQKSGLEKFSSLLEIRSLQWHERRHQIAQDFLTVFVRQNIAEIDEIEYEEQPVVMDLPPAERAIYLELENYLKSLEMNSSKALKSKKSSKGDRESRMQRILSDSDSAAEALLKRCAHFNMSSIPSTALETCDLIIDFRKGEKVDCENDLMESIAAAIRQRKRIVAIQPDWQGTARTEKGEVQDLLERFISDVKKKNSIAGGADDEIHGQVLKVLKMAQKEAEKHHLKADSAFDKANQDDEDDDEDDDEGQTKKRKLGKKRDPEERLYTMKMALREHMHIVRNLAKELRGRMQSLRYFEWVRSFQLEETELKCIGHGSSFCECQVSGEKLTRDKLGVLSSCGHVGCLKCLRHHADKEECIDPTCRVPVKYAHISSASDLGADRDHAAGGQYGAKLRAIVDKIKQLVRDGDRVIVFVQFDDLKEKVSEALQDGGVKSLQVKGTVQQQVKALNVLQKEIPDKDDPRVLLLKMDDERSSGINLTTCNHAVFVHPLLADTQQQYDAYETQAIGRIRRYGQTKKVNIWRYLARDTIDTEIAEERLNIQPI